MLRSLQRDWVLLYPPIGIEQTNDSVVATQDYRRNTVVASKRVVLKLYKKYQKRLFADLGLCQVIMFKKRKVNLPKVQDL